MYKVLAPSVLVLLASCKGEASPTLHLQEDVAKMADYDFGLCIFRPAAEVGQTFGALIESSAGNEAMPAYAGTLTFSRLEGNESVFCAVATGTLAFPVVKYRVDFGDTFKGDTHIEDIQLVVTYFPAMTETGAPRWGQARIQHPETGTDVYAVAVEGDGRLFRFTMVNVRENETAVLARPMTNVGAKPVPW